MGVNKSLLAHRHPGKIRWPWYILMNPPGQPKPLNYFWPRPPKRTPVFSREPFSGIVRAAIPSRCQPGKLARAGGFARTQPDLALGRGADISRSNIILLKQTPKSGLRPPLRKCHAKHPFFLCGHPSPFKRKTRGRDLQLSARFVAVRAPRKAFFGHDLLSWSCKPPETARPRRRGRSRLGDSTV